MFRLCLLAAGAAAISTDAIVDDVDATLRSALSHLRENLKDVHPAELARPQAAPNLVRLLATARDDPETLAAQLAASPLAAGRARGRAPPTRASAAAGALPIVTAHGMGDSCFNTGMKSVTAAAGKRVGAYAVCVPTADNRVGDTIDGFLKNMDRSVDAFAERVRKDPKLKNGFNAIGLSQGNNVIRGYIAKYNDPPVRTFLSICGCNAGVAAWPQCSPAGKLIRARLPGARRGFGRPRVSENSAGRPLPGELLSGPAAAQGRRVPRELAAGPLERRVPRERDVARQLPANRKIRLGRGHARHGRLPARRRALGRAGPGRPLEGCAGHEADGVGTRPTRSACGRPTSRASTPSSPSRASTSTSRTRLVWVALRHHDDDGIPSPPVCKTLLVLWHKLNTYRVSW